MNAATAFALSASAFLLGLGAMLWWQMGPAIFLAIQDFGLLICG